MSNDIVELVPYDPSWCRKAEAEISRLKKLLDFSNVVDIKHFGSTAIVGMPAKPIIDLLVGVTDLGQAQALISVLEADGYGFWADNPKKDRMFFVKGRPPLGEKRTHHVHVFETAHQEWTARTLFCRYLNEHLETAQAYRELKEQLAETHREDREAYTQAKEGFVKGVVAKARMLYGD